MTTDARPPRLAAQSLGYRYGKTSVLDGVDLSVRPGERVAIIGPNGAGKSTLLRLLAGSSAPHDGRVLLDGADLARMRGSDRARRIAFVPQESHPVFDFTVLEIVLMGRSPRLGPLGIEGPADLQAALRALSFTDTEALAERPLSRLSSGERQRVLLARALAQEPDVLLLDEPTAFLDLGHQVQIHGLLEALNRNTGMTVVFVSHDLNLASRYADRTVLLDRGRIAADGPPRAVLVPDILRAVYGVEVRILQDAASPYPQILLLGPATGASKGDARA